MRELFPEMERWTRFQCVPNMNMNTYSNLSPLICDWVVSVGATLYIAVGTLMSRLYNIEGIPVTTNDPRIKDDFWMYVFKMKCCNLQHYHDAVSCPYIHWDNILGERRRDPCFHDASVCENFRSGNCVGGDRCAKAHGLYEHGLHPMYFRTRYCRDGDDCNYAICFYAHTITEKREPRGVLPIHLRSHHMGFNPFQPTCPILNQPQYLHQQPTLPGIFSLHNVQSQLSYPVEMYIHPHDPQLNVALHPQYQQQERAIVVAVPEQAQEDVQQNLGAMLQHGGEAAFYDDDDDLRIEYQKAIIMNLSLEDIWPGACIIGT